MSDYEYEDVEIPEEGLDEAEIEVNKNSVLIHRGS